MIRRHGARAAALLAVVLLAPSACADDEPRSDAPATSTTAPSGSPAPTASSTAPTSTPASMTTTTAGVRLIEVTFAAGQVAGGMKRSSVHVGERVRIRVSSDVPDEIHVHTYDLTAAVGPGQPAQIDFVASIPGRHEVELEKKGKQLLVLEVR